MYVVKSMASADRDFSSFCLIRRYTEGKLDYWGFFSSPMCDCLLNSWIERNSSFHSNPFGGVLKLCIYDWTVWSRQAVPIHYQRQRERSHSNRQVVKPPIPNPLSRYDSSIDRQTKLEGSCVINNTNVSAILSAFVRPVLYLNNGKETKRLPQKRKWPEVWKCLWTEMVILLPLCWKKLYTRIILEILFSLVKVSFWKIKWHFSRDQKLHTHIITFSEIYMTGTVRMT